MTPPADPGLLLIAGLACLALAALCLIAAAISAITDHDHTEPR
ncbi:MULTISPECIES: hypothetical protein [unclassified Streptomyces]|nr:hypothetical protein [Streptomyces sp. NBC_00228]